jgi:hypothetical protein
MKQPLVAWLQNPTSHPALNLIAKECLSWCSFAEWREASGRRADRKEMILHMLALRFAQSVTQEIEASELIANFDFWSRTVAEIDLDRICKEKAITGELSRTLVDAGFDLRFVKLYLLSLHEDGNQHLRQFLTESFSHVSKEQWSTALNTDSDLIDLALSLKSDGLTLKLTFQDALYDFAESSVNKTGKSDSRLEWKSVIGLLNESEMNVLRVRMLSLFKKPNGRIGGMLPFFGGLIEEFVLEDGPENSYETIKEMIENPDQTELEWLTVMLEKWTPQSKKTRDTERNLLQRVEDTIAKEWPENLQAALNGLRLALDGMRGSKNSQERSQDDVASSPH